MPAEVHPTAIIHKNAFLNDGVTVGPYTIIEDDTVLGEGTEVGSHAL
ncbi:MAG: acyl-[acyl-carrier-protein]--UDP-N-acetylglucosamine O-acyltransferase, partial [Candidatus Marinimicrobia bacterium]|nr:acyl-[acyl-carrier-protein]--UDP-N-acetylglucosamine O-acyltransferase [Candidatus Neomarinimicrobiota bacterium]